MYIVSARRTLLITLHHHMVASKVVYVPLWHITSFSQGSKSEGSIVRASSGPIAVLLLAPFGADESPNEGGGNEKWLTAAIVFIAGGVY
jgi:hypothetical protein